MKFNNSVSVYMINGFLESGKTQFIKYTLAQPYFKIKGKTLIILCEEGEEEYDEALLKSSNTVLELVEDEKDFTVERLTELEKEVHPERIVIEFNGMWNHKNITLPSNWSLDQQITLIDAESFPMYYTNMRSLVAEHIRGSEMIIFNRCNSDNVSDLANFKRNVKGVNAAAEVIFEDSNGEINVSLAEDLPYNLEDEVIVLDDAGYAVWYIDIMDNPERYEGKTIEYIGTVVKPPTFETEYFVPGRMAMTCCADDMVFLGFACKFKGAKDLPEKSWVRVNATIHLEYFEAYQGQGPVLYSNKITTVKQPKNPVIDFSNL